MKTINIGDRKLYDIEEKEGIKVGRLIQKMVRNELIPMDVIKFINKYDKDFLQIYNTYNVIYNSRNKNPLYRNLKNKDLKIVEFKLTKDEIKSILNLLN